MNRSSVWAFAHDFFWAFFFVPTLVVVIIINSRLVVKSSHDHLQTLTSSSTNSVLEIILRLFAVFCTTSQCLVFRAYPLPHTPVCARSVVTRFEAFQPPRFSCVLLILKGFQLFCVLLSSGSQRSSVLP